MLTFPSETTILQILPFAVFILFGISWIIQMIFYWMIYGKLAFYRRKEENTDQKPVSVVICAKNEYQNLLHNLPSVLEQDYPDYEVIVVNDASDDDSIELLNSFSRKYKHLRIFNLERNLNFFSGKKFPLSLGIKSAQNEIILLTDADCQPASSLWIKNMVSNYDMRTDIVLGYGTYKKAVGFLNRLIRYDSFLVAMQYFSFALSGSPYMGVGRNLSYRKELFYKAKGFTSHYKLNSGDDDLFINRAANRANTRIEISPEAQTVSIAKTSLVQWIIQKRRHYSTAYYYRPVFKFFLSLNYASKLLLYLSFITLIFLNCNRLIALIAFSVFFLSHWLIMAFSTNKMRENDLAVLSPVFEVMVLALSPLIYFSNYIVKQEKWK